MRQFAALTGLVRPLHFFIESYKAKHYRYDLNISGLLLLNLNIGSLLIVAMFIFLSLVGRKYLNHIDSALLCMIQ
ncbi:MAG: hypothetical protein E6Q62_11650 [Nitrosomonas sp.]|nr:MAG: hypothetical protein E6Q62_11650 [Nitrosomonas sp.]